MESQLAYNDSGFLRRGRMDLLLNPNIGYVLLITGMIFTLIAIMTPGTGLPELVAAFSILLAAYAVYHLSFNWWALGLMLLSVLPFYYSIRGPRRGWWLAISILGLTIGSIFFFPANKGIISVNPILAVVTTLLYSLFLWISVRKIVEISVRRPVHELTELVGRIGETKTAVGDGGSVQVAGELWSARSAEPIAAGSAVRVVGCEGFVLIIEKDRTGDRLKIG
jgi:membrane-bound ClpP family serine protease